MKNIEILMQTEFDSRIVPIKFDGYDKMVMLAGTPVDSGGKFANGATAIGILIEDVTRSYPYGEIVVSGFVDYEAAKKYSEVDYTKECMTALKNIVFEGVGDQWVEAGGSEFTYTASTEDIEAGVTSLETGTFYFVYE